MNPWEILLRRLMAARTWPLMSERDVHKWLLIWAALRENDEPVIRRLMKWPSDRPLIIDNLPEKIGAAFGDLLFGEDPSWTAANEADQERETDLTASWPSVLQNGEETCVTEGEVYWRLSLNPALPHPSLTFHGRNDVVPLLHGRDVLACAFVSRLDPPTSNAGRNQEVFRHVEIHDRRNVINTLWRGRDEILGQQVDLTRHIETAILPERWEHDLGILAGRIVNRWGRRPHFGRSIYAGVWPRLLALNEATTVGRENMRLTAKKRIVLSSASIRASSRLPDPSDPRVQQAIASGAGIPVQSPNGPSFDAGEDVLVHDQLDAEEGASQRDPFKVLEYSFEADQLIAWLRFEIETICQRCDLVPQFIGSGDFGSGASGTALRVRLLPTTNAAEGRGRAWDDILPVITGRAQLLENLGVPFGGLGRDWTAPAEVPSVERSMPLPEDENETATRHATLKTADLMSTQQSIAERYPDWSEDQVKEEVARIRADVADTMPRIPNFGGGDPPPPPDPPGQQ